MENQPHYPSDPKSHRFSIVAGWEEGIKKESDAKANYIPLKHRLERLGIPLTTDTKILEIGSGSNVFLKLLQEQGHDAVGIDSRPRGEKAENVVAGRIEQLPFPNETFELIISNSLFDPSVYHQDQVIMVKEIARVLKQGGIYCDTLNFDGGITFDPYFEVLEKSSRTIGSSVYRKK